MFESCEFQQTKNLSSSSNLSEFKMTQKETLKANRKYVASLCLQYKQAISQCSIKRSFPLAENKIAVLL